MEKEFNIKKNKLSKVNLFEQYWTFIIPIVSIILIGISFLFEQQTQSICQGIGISLFASWLLFFLVEYLPTKSKEKKAIKFALPHLKEIHYNANCIIETILFHSGIISDGNYSNLDFDKILKLSHIQENIRIEHKTIIMDKRVSGLLTSSKHSDVEEYQKYMRNEILLLQNIWFNLSNDLAIALSELNSIDISEAFKVSPLNEYTSITYNHALVSCFEILLKAFNTLEIKKISNRRVIIVKYDDRYRDNVEFQGLQEVVRQNPDFENMIMNKDKIEM